MLPSNLKRQILQHYNDLLNGLTVAYYTLYLRNSIFVCKKYLYDPECKRQCWYSIHTPSYFCPKALDQSCVLTMPKQVENTKAGGFCFSSPWCTPTLVTTLVALKLQPDGAYFCDCLADSETHDSGIVRHRRAQSRQIHIPLSPLVCSRF